jgi:hypothetical protein
LQTIDGLSKIWQCIGQISRELPLPDDVLRAIKEYLKLDEKRRRNLHSDGENAYLFQPLVNYRTLEFDKALSPRMMRNIVASSSSPASSKFRSKRWTIMASASALAAITPAKLSDISGQVTAHH